MFSDNGRRTGGRGIWVLLVVLGAAPPIAAGQDLSGPGPYAAGYITVTVTRPDSSTFASLLFYPATAGGEGAPYEGSGAPYPAISFGHGFLTNPERYQGTLEHLATWGYFVMATRSGLELFPNHAEYAQDLSHCLTYLESENADPASPLFGQVDTARFGLSGHSMGGGASVLATAADPRVKALANLAAAETNPSAVDAAAAMTIPVRLIAGDEDGIAPPAQHTIPIYENANAPRQLPMILGGYHCGFLDDPPAFFCDSGSISLDVQLALTRRLLTEFFHLYLYEDQSVWRQVWGPELADDPLVDTSRAEAGIAWEPSDAAAGGPAGELAQAEFLVRNTSLLSESYTLFAEDNNWPTTLTPNPTPVLAPGETVTVTVGVEIPAGGADADTALLSARSDLDGGTRGYATLLTQRRDPADFDGDGDVDLADFTVLAGCLTGPGGGILPGCDDADLDSDDDTDLQDAAVLLRAFTGPATGRSGPAPSARRAYRPPAPPPAVLPS